MKPRTRSVWSTFGRSTERDKKKRRRPCGCRHDEPRYCTNLRYGIPLSILSAADECGCKRCHYEKDEE